MARTVCVGVQRDFHCKISSNKSHSISSDKPVKATQDKSQRRGDRTEQDSDGSVSARCAAVWYTRFSCLVLLLNMLAQKASFFIGFVFLH